MTGDERFQRDQLVGRYRIVRLIGEGGMGAVYEAIHPGLKKRVAVKVLLPRVGENQDARARFLREGEAASRINHPHVVSVLDVGEDGGAPYLVMEYLEGRTLAEFLAERGALELVEAAELFLPIVAAVAAGHDCGVVHRDLKPQNIFLARGRWGELVPKVLDFGVSKLIDHDGPPITRTETVLGTACYMSPEQARGARHVEARSDQFTLGLILYEMLTGRRAYQGANDLEILYNAAAGAVPPAHQVRAGLPDELYVLLTRMLALAPPDRYPSLREGARLLLPFASEKIRSAMTGDFATPISVAPAVDRPATSAEEPSRSGPSAPPAQQTARLDLPKTALLPLTLEPRGDTALLPVTQPLREDTTLRHAAIQSRRKDPAKSRTIRPAAKVVAAAGTAAVVVGAILAWKATPERKTLTPVPIVAAPSPEPPASVAPSGAAAVPQAPAPADEPVERATPFEVRAFPPDADIVLDGGPALRGRRELVLPLPGASHELRVSAAGYVPKVISFGAEQPPPAEIRLDPVPASAPPGGARKALRRPRVVPARRGTNDALIIK
jgi:serine/threonine protein kinase